MAEVSNLNPISTPPQPRRLKRKAPTSIQINNTPATAADWNVAAIPLLSPLVQSPSVDRNLTAEIIKSSSGGVVNGKKESENAVVAVVMKKWQHPAAPFCYEPAPAPFTPFV